MAQKQTYRIKGAVVDANGKPIELATVSLNSALVTSTNQKGLFEFVHVPAGKYACHVTFVGF